jgi:uncharacterized protein involved in tolerance to divalent cations
MPQHYLVITSWPDFDGAQQQARNWVEKKLAASVNILPKMDSIYIWKGELRSGKEQKFSLKPAPHGWCSCKTRLNLRIRMPWLKYYILR